MNKQVMTTMSVNREYPMRSQGQRMAAKGFTLVELIVVVAILAVLASLVVPSYTHLVEKAKISASTSNIRTLEKSILAYAAEKGDLPPALNVLTDIAPKDLIDPWGNMFEYENLITNPGDAIEDSMLGTLNADFDLYSKGPNGASDKVYDVATGKDDIVRSGDGGFVGLRP